MVDGITLVGAYFVTKAVAVGIEEIFSWNNTPSDSTIRNKISALYNRYLNPQRQIAIRLLWKNIPFGICAFLIDKDDVLFNLGRLGLMVIVIINPTAPNLDSFFSESSFMTNISKIIIFTCVISTARVGGAYFCNYLQQRVPPPLNNILRRLQNGIDMR